MSSLSGSEVESENEDDAGTSETGTSSNDQTKNESSSKTGLNKSRKASERRGKAIESDISDTEYNEEMSKERKLQVVASRHTKVFFENDDGNIFSIYRCLLHHKKVCLLAGLSPMLDCRQPMRYYCYTWKRYTCARSIILKLDVLYFVRVTWCAL